MLGQIVSLRVEFIPCKKSYHNILVLSISAQQIKVFIATKRKKPYSRPQHELANIFHSIKFHVARSVRMKNVHMQYYYVLLILYNMRRWHNLDKLD